MSKINEGFVGDDESKEEGLGSRTSPDSSNEITRAEDPHSGEIDYSKASKSPLFLASFAATLSAYILGACLGWASPVQPQLQQNSSFVSVTDPDSVWYINLDDSQMAWVGSLINAGALCGALVGGFLMDRFGRKTVLIFLSVPFVIGWLLLILAVDPSMLYIGRFLGGLAGGTSSVVAPSYVGEIAIPSLRGTLGFFFQLQVCLGILITSLFGLGLDWRLISAISAAIPLIFLIAMIFVPESPYYLIKKGQREEGKKSMQWLRGPQYNIEREMAELEARVRVELSMKSSFGDLLRPWAFKPLLVAVFLMVFQQLSGINAALFNAVRIFNSAGSDLDPLVSAVLLNVTQLVMTLVAAVLVVRVGRRTLFLSSQAIMCVCMFALGAFFYIQKNDPATAATLGWLPLTSLVLFIAGFGIGAGPIPWLMFGEILPAKVKGPGSSIASFTNWFLAFIITLTFVDIQKGIGEAGSFWLFGVFTFLAVMPFSVFFLPETKGKTPEQIQAFFGTKLPSSTNP